ncbi:hypothetical protein GCM10010401_17810 [Rarobacter faecitabidus]|uniref:Uncharacterized protein n=1 Tax=Rarobacter faecitabidus TaxID=13243 RepID=A0A542ZUH0_RARFA|nr:hypothetical protein FB461_0475 [Rarobacter faecitabidus]
MVPVNAAHPSTEWHHGPGGRADEDSQAALLSTQSQRCFNGTAAPALSSVSSYATRTETHGEELIAGLRVPYQSLPERADQKEVLDVEPELHHVATVRNNFAIVGYRNQGSALPADTVHGSGQALASAA